jgi:uncharacterized alpha-E superfamily protein
MSMLSRVAGSLYRAGASVEHADHVARTVDVHVTLTLDRGGRAEPELWPRVLSLLEIEGEAVADPRQAVQIALFGAGPHSLRQSIHDARQEAMSVRPSISSEVYESLNQLHWALAEARQDVLVHDFAVWVQREVALLYGLIDETMDHDERWEFLRLGRQLERAANGVRLVTRKLEWLRGVDDALEWAAVLRSCSAFEAYRWRVSAGVEPASVVRFLLLDQTLPRSARSAIAEALVGVRRIDRDGEPSEPHRLLGQLSALFEYTVANQVVEDPAGFGAACAALSADLSNSLASTYFRPTRPDASRAAAAPAIWARPTQQPQQQQ